MNESPDKSGGSRGLIPRGRDVMKVLAVLETIDERYAPVKRAGSRRQEKPQMF